jgi:hypothetical protein
MGLFDGYVDPQQFNSGGGLLGRMLALQQFQGQYQTDADSGQASSVFITDDKGNVVVDVTGNVRRR